jgi:RimJ/RimL family protein N-acetyltransferase
VPPVERVSIATKRLVLRPTTAADADGGFRIQSEWDVTRMLRMASFPPDRQAMRLWFADHEREWQAGEAYRFAVEVDGHMAGIVDIDEVGGFRAELGYWFDRPAWGKGYAFEAAQAAVGFAFGTIGLSTLISGHAEDNPASGRVLSKLGFIPSDTVEVFSRPRNRTIRQRRYVLDAARI